MNDSVIAQAYFQTVPVFQGLSHKKFSRNVKIL